MTWIDQVTENYQPKQQRIYYPKIFFERKLFEDLMGNYRYVKNEGWGHTNDIAHNFKAIDFYDDFTELGNDIFAETAVSMKTTTTKNVSEWLNSEPIKKNLGFLKDGLENGISSNGKNIFFKKAEIHIYMPKDNLASYLTSQWMMKLTEKNPTINFEIKALEDYIK